MGVLLDTSVLVQLERARAQLELDFDDEVAVSAITASELLHGVHRAATSGQASRREAFVARVLTTIPVVPFDTDIARVHARIWAQLAGDGVTIGAHDLIIAATALARGWDLATHNMRDFARVPGLQLRGDLDVNGQHRPI